MYYINHCWKIKFLIIQNIHFMKFCKKKTIDILKLFYHPSKKIYIFYLTIGLIIIDTFEKIADEQTEKVWYNGIRTL